ncbi:hypothetical protein GUJ93_ZPchr0002g26768 [Zizania palustris]|uniref:VQ domain-containing protein n=1 Tax=Zizania palustris TaxID=103762 RepID=A0A8J5R1F1_ZIZPA|nr:hypothetical protein GUJ93_ZPchr0040g33531 [Zizania palustris]KAG8058223.1 hypothetical protein GUJ93_ZPchr0002g26768 [Zizania palustris]
MGDAGGGNMAHWAALYGGGGNGGPMKGEGSEVTVSSPTSGSSVGSPTRVAAQQPGIEGGRIGKPARRRSRASRRAPVTLLNTDTSNFRAMVQQFTGIPSSGLYGGGGGVPVISFGAAGADYVIGIGSGGGAMPVRPSPTSAIMSFDQLQQHRQTPPATSVPSLHSHLFRPQQPQYGNVVYGGMHGGFTSAAGAGDMFLHGFESSSEDRLLLQSMQAAQMLSRPASTNGYNFE